MAKSHRNETHVATERISMFCLLIVRFVSSHSQGSIHLSLARSLCIAINMCAAFFLKPNNEVEVELLYPPTGHQERNDSFYCAFYSWTIPNFVHQIDFNLRPGNVLYSDIFNCGGLLCYLKLYPLGRNDTAVTSDPMMRQNRTLGVFFKKSSLILNESTLHLKVRIFLLDTLGAKQMEARLFLSFNVFLKF